MLAALLTTVLFSVSAVSGSRSSRMMGGTEAHFWRMLLAVSLLAIYAHAFGQALVTHALGWFVMSGCIGFGIGDVALFQALPRLGSRLSILLVTCFSSPMAAVMEWAWLGTRLTGLEILCALIILGGVSVALLPAIINQNSRLTCNRKFGSCILLVTSDKRIVLKLALLV
jgi:drug/metabolite transporter (DMT)-like permease